MDILVNDRTGSLVMNAQAAFLLYAESWAQVTGTSETASLPSQIQQTQKCILHVTTLLTDSQSKDMKSKKLFRMVNYFQNY